MRRWVFQLGGFSNILSLGEFLVDAVRRLGLELDVGTMESSGAGFLGASLGFYGVCDPRRQRARVL